jgi:hypothetical protein
MKAICQILVCLLGFVSTAAAFPPAPYYTLYGMVRDQVGQTVTAEGAEIILLKGGVEIGRTPITSGQLDHNYELNIRIDAARSGTVFYSDKAVAALGEFSLVVAMNGDYDRDGQNNLQEYLAGTFAGDATETFALALKEKLPQSVRFEFYAITGKVYTIESTLDMKTWTRVAFAVGAPGTGSEAYQASQVGILSIFTAPRSNTGEFFRLTVR